MTHFINPDEFPNDDELLDHIIDNVVFPSLSEQVGPDEMEHVQGIAYVFGGRNDVDPAIIGKLYSLVETEGVPLEYALHEFTSLKVGKVRHASRGGLHIHYMELSTMDEDDCQISPEELQAMYDYP